MNKFNLLTTALLAIFSLNARADVVEDTSTELQMKDIQLMTPEQTALLNITPTTRPPRSQPALKIWAERKIYPLGSHIVIHARATHDGYLTLLAKGSSGKTVQLLPNGKTDGYVKGGTTVSFPAYGDKRYWFEATRPIGKTLVKGLFSKSPNSVFGENSAAKASFNNDFFASSDAPAELISKDIALELARPERQGWDAAEVVVDIVPENR